MSVEFDCEGCGQHVVWFHTDEADPPICMACTELGVCRNRLLQDRLDGRITWAEFKEQWEKAHTPKLNRAG
jgi:hypothetical protein